jgi:hypothetical protein
MVAIIMLPVGILMAFAAMKVLGIGSNIMSLGGIAIAIGAMIDGPIVMIENAHKHLERAPPGKPRREVLIEAASEVGPALFFSLLIITVSFLPIFTMDRRKAVCSARWHTPRRSRWRRQHYECASAIQQKMKPRRIAGSAQVCRPAK